MFEALSIDFNRPVPLFPLAGCVLLPHATIPLNIFEPRYRKMTRDALDGPGLIATAMFEGDEWKHNYHGNPPVREHVCVGHIVRHDKLHDGRYHIMLHGVCRARIEEEIEHDPYRLVQLDPVDTNPPFELDYEYDRDQLSELLDDPDLKRLAAVGAMQNWMSKQLPTAAMVDLAVMVLCNDPNARYDMLAEPELHARADWLRNYLEQTRATLRLADKLGDSQSEDGYHLN